MSTSLSTYSTNSELLIEPNKNPQSTISGPFICRVTSLSTYSTNFNLSFRRLNRLNLQGQGTSVPVTKPTSLLRSIESAKPRILFFPIICTRSDSDIHTFLLHTRIRFLFNHHSIAFKIDEIQLINKTKNDKFSQQELVSIHFSIIPTLTGFSFMEWYLYHEF